MTNFIKNVNENISELRNEIQCRGVAFFESNFSTNSYVEFGEKFGKIFYHHDSSENGITVVSSVKDKEKAKDGEYGFTSSMLFSHTDRSTMNQPPTILIFFCKEQSGDGGETILVDMQQGL